MAGILDYMTPEQKDAAGLGVNTTPSTNYPAVSRMGALDGIKEMWNRWGAKLKPKTPLAPIVPAEDASGQSLASRFGEVLNRNVGGAIGPSLDVVNSVLGATGDVAQGYFGAMPSVAKPAALPGNWNATPAINDASGSSTKPADIAAMTAAGAPPVADFRGVSGPGAIRKIVAPDGRTTYTDQGTGGNVLEAKNVRGGFVASVNPDGSPAVSTKTPEQWRAEGAAADERMANWRFENRPSAAGDGPQFRTRTDAEIAQNAKNDAMIAIANSPSKVGANAVAYLQSLEQGNTARLNNAAMINATREGHALTAQAAQEKHQIDLINAIQTGDLRAAQAAASRFQTGLGVGELAKTGDFGAAGAAYHGRTTVPSFGAVPTALPDPKTGAIPMENKRTGETFMSIPKKTITLREVVAKDKADKRYVSDVQSRRNAESFGYKLTD